MRVKPGVTIETLQHFLSLLIFGAANDQLSVLLMKLVLLAVSMVTPLTAGVGLQGTRTGRTEVLQLLRLNFLPWFHRKSS